ncbi:MAG: glycosyltransferase family 2 protein [Planctomycetales bacterium]|nr:glycosyltransferase family 2 protein [Planctomycetales bacterium]
MAAPITVIIPCKDEAVNIADCIASVRPIAAEILVADSGSSDETLEIVARAGGCRVIEREYVDSANFKNWAIPQATHEWIFLIDADERLTPELVAEIQAIVARAPEKDGYWVYRANYFMGKRIRFSGWQNDRVIRLFRRDVSRYEDILDHSEVQLAPERVGRLRHRMPHFTYRSYDQYFPKFHRYTKRSAAFRYSRGRRPSGLQLLLRGPFRFLRSYILKLGFLDGLAGLQLSVLSGFYSYMKEARLWELDQQARLDRHRASEADCSEPQRRAA